MAIFSHTIKAIENFRADDLMQKTTFELSTFEEYIGGIHL